MDTISDDGRFAITLIAFVGSVFSPYYAWSGRQEPLNHCAVNVALYGVDIARWAMTERGQAEVERSEQRLRIGPSILQWNEGALEIDVNEICAPLPKRVRGKIRITPVSTPARAFSLDPQSNHIWQPIAPQARVAVRLQHPKLNWNGNAYLDSNFGTEPLEAGFQEWHWSRVQQKKNAVVLYDARRRDGSDISLALSFAEDGRTQAIQAPPGMAFPTTAWRLKRATRGDADHSVHLVKTLEDTPFYARSRIGMQINGERAEGFHESLSLDRFASPFVRAMLPFRMPRRLF